MQIFFLLWRVDFGFGFGFRLGLGTDDLANALSNCYLDMFT